MKTSAKTIMRSLLALVTALSCGVLGSHGAHAQDEAELEKLMTYLEENSENLYNRAEDVAVRAGMALAEGQKEKKEFLKHIHPMARPMFGNDEIFRRLAQEFPKEAGGMHGDIPAGFDIVAIGDEGEYVVVTDIMYVWQLPDGSVRQFVVTVSLSETFKDDADLSADDVIKMLNASDPKVIDFEEAVVLELEIEIPEPGQEKFKEEPRESQPKQKPQPKKQPGHDSRLIV